MPSADNRDCMTTLNLRSVDVGFCVRCLAARIHLAPGDVLRVIYDAGGPCGPGGEPIHCAATVFTGPREVVRHRLRSLNFQVEDDTDDAS